MDAMKPTSPPAMDSRITDSREALASFEQEAKSPEAAWWQTLAARPLAQRWAECETDIASGADPALAIEKHLCIKMRPTAAAPGEPVNQPQRDTTK